MDPATVNGVELEYEVVGAGEPVLLISPVLADGFVPLTAEPALAGYQLIRYHKRGWVGSTHTPGAVSVSDHAADAAALLAHLGVPTAHVAGHSSGAAVAAQLALEHPETVHTLALLELSLLSVPSWRSLLRPGRTSVRGLRQSGPRGRPRPVHERRERPRLGESRAVLDEHLPGAVEQAVKDADTFFGVELPALGEWTFGSEQAAAIGHPVLSVLGGKTQPLWVEVAAFLRASVPNVEECTIAGVGHLLHVERPKPVARAIAEFLGRNPIPTG